MYILFTRRIELYPNYPNPLNPTTNIGFQISESGFVELKVFDLLGKEVKMIVSENMSPGIYLYQLRSGTFLQIRKLILLR
ncbi:hypothetical protein BMS3Abin03_01319 [bacterium BMS3Abin03]|nr:hypothetical protein BMS3Abin03_01319 [bacterium BMS3Abin03]